MRVDDRATLTVRIVQAVGWYFPSHAGGTEVYVDELSRRLQVAGHEVLVAAPEPGGPGPRTYSHNGVPVFRYPIPLRPTRDEAQGRVVARGAAHFHQWLEAMRPDILHVHTFVTGLALEELRAAARLGIRTTVTTHSARLGFICQRGTLMRFGRRLCDGHIRTVTCSRCALQHGGAPRGAADALALVPPPLAAAAARLPGKVGTALGMPALIRHNRRSQHAMFDVIERFVVLTEHARRAVIANGAPAEQTVLNRLGVRFVPAPHLPRDPNRPLTIGYIGRFDPVKGVEDLARAIAGRATRLPIRFEFHGPVRNKADLAVQTRLKRIVGPDAWVVFGGELDAAGVRAALQRLDVVCCPSRVIEGGPTVALEARAAGVPVIGSDLPGLSEIVRDGVDGRLVPAGDWRALAALFSELAAEPSLVTAWQAALGPVRTMDDVAQEYMLMYAGRVSS